MSDPTYADAITTETSAEIRDGTLLPAIEAQGTDVAGWPSIAPQRGLVEGDARALAYEQTLRAQMARTKSPTDCLAAGSSWVDARLGWFALDDGTGGKGRIRATRAIWGVSMRCAAAAAPMVFDNTSKVVVQTSGGVYFESAETGIVTLNSGNSYTASVHFQARAPGASGNVAPSSFVAVVSGPAGLSIGPSTNVLVTAARDDETDAVYVARALAEWARLGVAWTLASFDFWIPLLALSVTGWRIRDDNSYGAGSVGVILRNATGPATDPEVAAVAAGLGGRAVRALGSGPLVVQKAVADALTIDITIEGDGTNSTLDADATAAVLALCAAMPLGVATLDDGIIRSVALGGQYAEISVDMGGGVTKKIAPTLPGFGGALSIVSCSLSAPHTIPIDRVLVPTVNITVT